MGKSFSVIESVEGDASERVRDTQKANSLFPVKKSAPLIAKDDTVPSPVYRVASLD
ncbi:MAG: hypothetical protein QHI48_05835 [Bacteroidota bacterium]|nr:hypothetical protein [Bacteroidota bacterium]